MDFIKQFFGLVEFAILNGLFRLGFKLFALEGVGLDALGLRFQVLVVFCDFAQFFIPIFQRNILFL